MNCNGKLQMHSFSLLFTKNKRLILNVSRNDFDISELDFEKYT